MKTKHESQQCSSPSIIGTMAEEEVGPIKKLFTFVPILFLSVVTDVMLK